MKKLALLLLLPLALLAAPVETKISLTDGKAVFVTVPAAWTAAALPTSPGNPEVSTSVQYVTKSGSNDSVLITFIAVPDDRLDNPETLKAMVEESSQQLVPGSVEGKVIPKPFAIGTSKGLAVTFTDAKLVGKPTVKDDFKALTSCFVYLGNHTFVTASIFTDDVNGPAYAEAVRLVQSCSLLLPGKSI